MDRMTLRRVWSAHRNGLDTGHDLKLLQFRDFDHLDRKRLLSQLVIVDIAEGVKELLSADGAEDAKLLLPALHFWCVFYPDKERAEAANVVHVKMRDPDRTDIWPVDT